MEGEKGTVCVTGGAGYMASWLIMRLLKHGYSVRATIRSDPKFKEDTSHLISLPEAPHRLQIFDADLENPESYESVVDGCIGVFHLSHPMDFEGNIPTESIVKTSVQGTLGILQACFKSKTVKKVVYTSSIAAALLVGQTDNGTVIDENTWTDIKAFTDFNFPGAAYIVSKTLTERAVLEFSKEHALDVVTILPAAIFGPFISSTFPPAFPMSLPLIFGKEEHCMDTAHYVHIDDVASAQIFLFECPKSKGRHLCCKFDVTIQEVAKLLSIKWSQHLLPLDFLSRMEEKRPNHLSSKKLMDLGFSFKYSLEEMIDGALQCCKEKGFL
ncbi:Dihydroflavonol-4-reductase-like [Thalictrum thalictroides]|uniref:Dihydroflavonol-4-reductase-like n=1 Tax=Thalictrum thalictroides TaxID=46969 RepID=A0A7J6UVL0_THATH|nr:Dihydroflavonol-4-reductase-like [Thalictrum thalictroides]